MCQLLYHCQKLSSIKLGNKVNAIGVRAFENCESLVNISLPDSLKEIGCAAFSNGNYTAFKIPDGVETIGSQAFAWNYKLKSIVIPSSVKTIISNPFSGINIDIINESGNFVLKDSVLFSKDMSRLIYFGKNCEEYSVPEPVRIIGGEAFGYTKIKKIILPETLNKIEEHAFWGCSSLSYINNIEDNIEIGDYAFAGCNLRIKGIKTNYPVSDTDIDMWFDYTTDYDYFWDVT